MNEEIKILEHTIEFYKKFCEEEEGLNPIITGQEVKALEKLLKRNTELQQQNEFLTKRENKLQTIEQMYKSGSVDLDKLRKIVLEEK